MRFSVRCTDVGAAPVSVQRTENFSVQRTRLTRSEESSEKFSEESSEKILGGILRTVSEESSEQARSVEDTD